MDWLKAKAKIIGDKAKAMFIDDLAENCVILSVGGLIGYGVKAVVG